MGSEGCWGHRGECDSHHPPPFPRVVLRSGLDLRHHPLVWEVVPLKFVSILDGHEGPLQRRGWELHVVPLFKEILHKLDVVKERSCVHNDGPDNAEYDLRGVRLLVLHAKQVTQHLEDL